MIGTEANRSAGRPLHMRANYFLYKIGQHRRRRCETISMCRYVFACTIFFSLRPADISFDICFHSRPQNDASVHGRSLRDPRVNNNIYHSEPAGVKMDEALQTSSAITQTDKRYQRFAIIADDFLFSLILERALFASDGEWQLD